MKKLVIILLLAISVIASYGQANNENSSQSRKENRKLRIDKEYNATKYMLENKDFVLETDYLENRYGYLTHVDQNINFVKIDSTTAVIQIGSNFRIGPNGVGGVTAKGTITRWKLQENEKSKTFNLVMTVMTPIGIYDLHFIINPGGQATARLSGTRSGTLTFDGKVVPIEESTVYEGQSI